MDSTKRQPRKKKRVNSKIDAEQTNRIDNEQHPKDSQKSEDLQHPKDIQQHEDIILPPEIQQPKDTQQQDDVKHFDDVKQRDDANQPDETKQLEDIQQPKDIFIDIEPKQATTILVTERPEEHQQVKSDQDVKSNVDEQLSSMDTLTRLSTPNGSQVYLLGTAHFSTKSAQDVQNVMQTIRPSAVILELCKERAFMLTLDEESLLEQNKSLSFDKIKSAIAQKGLAQGLIYIMFIKMSASLTEKLGLAPGSEFRAGAIEAQKIPGCSVVLGDRSLKITIARAVASITAWQKLKLIYHVLISDVTITQEEVEKCKDKDILEQLLLELGGEFPGFKRVLLDERNVYLAHSIYQWAQLSETSLGPQKILAIVGIGHVGGIVENWGKTTEEDIKTLNQIPESSKTRRVVTKTIKYCSFAIALYFGYKLIIPSSIQTAIHDKLVNR